MDIHDLSLFGRMLCSLSPHISTWWGNPPMFPSTSVGWSGTRSGVENGTRRKWDWDSFWGRKFLARSIFNQPGARAVGGRGRSTRLRACQGRCPGRHWQGQAFTGSGKDHDPISRAWSSKPVQSSMKILELRVRRRRRTGRLPDPPVCLPEGPDRPASGTVISRLRVGLDRTSDVLSDGL